MLRLLTDKIRPFASNFTQDERPSLHVLCHRLYDAYYLLESDEDLEMVDFSVDEGDVLVIYANICEEDSDDAAVILHQARQAHYETRNSKPAVKLVSRKTMDKLLAAEVLPEDDHAYGNHPQTEA